MRTTSKDVRGTNETVTRARAHRVRRVILAALLAANLTVLAIGSATGGAGAGKAHQLVAAADAFSPAR
jgi:hypothetical protein